jgi:tRNA threonylcarbamoyl adenosine modification protein YeaZ
MISLWIDTSGQDVSIGLVKDNKILSYINKCTPNQHSIYTTSYLHQVLDEAKIKPDNVDNIYVVNGPGSFTGIRIGVTIAKTYAYLLKKEIRCVSSLKSLAISNSKINTYYMSLIDAKHDNYYMGLYDNSYNEVVKESFYNKEEILKYIAEYQPYLISNQELTINNYQINKVDLDIVKIISYYQETKPINAHLANPNYLKQPQALEK